MLVLSMLVPKFDWCTIDRQLEKASGVLAEDVASVMRKEEVSNQTTSPLYVVCVATKENRMNLSNLIVTNHSRQPLVYRSA
jgi:hypothetical protein